MCVSGSACICCLGSTARTTHLMQPQQCGAYRYVIRVANDTVLGKGLENPPLP